MWKWMVSQGKAAATVCQNHQTGLYKSPVDIALWRGKALLLMPWAPGLSLGMNVQNTVFFKTFQKAQRRLSKWKGNGAPSREPPGSVEGDLRSHSVSDKWPPTPGLTHTPKLSSPRLSFFLIRPELGFIQHNDRCPERVHLISLLSPHYKSQLRNCRALTLHIYLELQTPVH